MRPQCILNYNSLLFLAEMSHNWKQVFILEFIVLVFSQEIAFNLKLILKTNTILRILFYFECNGWTTLDSTPNVHGDYSAPYIHTQLQIQSLWWFDLPGRVPMRNTERTFLRRYFCWCHIGSIRWYLWRNQWFEHVYWWFFDW